MENYKVRVENEAESKEAMKEYLNEKYELITAPESEAKEPHAKGWIEVPNGAEILTVGIDQRVFWKGDLSWNLDGYETKEWRSTDSLPIYMKNYEKTVKVLWQRNAPTVPDEVNRSSKLKSVSETLKERQQQYGCFEDVAFVTENIMSILAQVRVNGLNDLPHTHRMALYMIASKMARIVNGDFNSIDGWHDIGGYAKLIEDLIGSDDTDIPF